MVVVENDPARDARAFEPVVAALEAFAPGVEIVRPGVCSVATRGPSRYFGGDEALAARVESAVLSRVPGSACRVGIADGPFAAALAARRGLGRDALARAVAALPHLLATYRPLEQLARAGPGRPEVLAWERPWRRLGPAGSGAARGHAARLRRAGLGWR